jgi:hypothetical protein
MMLVVKAASTSKQFSLPHWPLLRTLPPHAAVCRLSPRNQSWQSLGSASLQASGACVARLTTSLAIGGWPAAVVSLQA